MSPREILPFPLLYRPKWPLSKLATKRRRTESNYRRFSLPANSLTTHQLASEPNVSMVGKQEVIDRITISADGEVKRRSQNWVVERMCFRRLVAHPKLTMNLSHFLDQCLDATLLSPASFDTAYEPAQQSSNEKRGRECI